MFWEVFEYVMGVDGVARRRSQQAPPRQSLQSLHIAKEEGHSLHLLVRVVHDASAHLSKDIIGCASLRTFIHRFSLNLISRPEASLPQLHPVYTGTHTPLSKLHYEAVIKAFPPPPPPS